VVRRPRVVARLAGARDRVERPDELAVVGVVGFHSAARSTVGAREARDYEPVVVNRRRRDREIFLRSLGLDDPGRRARGTVERNELAVEPAHEDLVLADGDTAVV